MALSRIIKMSLNHKLRCLGNTAYVLKNPVRELSFWGTSKPPDWNKAVSEAEKIVGYPTSFMSLRCLLSDELSNVALQMRKLVGTKHPLLKTARKFLFDGKHNLQTRGLIILLISKTAGGTSDHENLEQNMASGIYPSQRSLAEIVEMIYTANLIHKGVVDLATLTSADSPVQEMEFGNKMAVLSGDFLLASASTGLAELKNTYVVEIISSAIGDLMEAEFHISHNENGKVVIPTKGISVEDWKQQTYLSEGSLLAKSCKCAMKLADQDETTQQKAFQFGENIAYARQIREELQPFMKSIEDNGNNASVISIPVVLQLQKKPELLKEYIQYSHQDSLCIADLIQDKPEVINECKQLCKTYGHEALSALNHFQKSETRTALENIVRAVISL